MSQLFFPRLSNIFLWAVACMLCVSGTSFANCAAPSETTPAGIANQSDANRLKFLTHVINEESKAANTWTFAWGGSYALLTMVQLSIMPLFPENEKPDWYWGAVSSGVGVAFSIIDPLEVLNAGPIFAARASKQMGEIETCQLIAEGERLLKDGSDHEFLGTRWFIHVANVAFNMGLGLVLGLGYQRWISGIINAAIGTAIGEATIFTEPTALISGWNQYISQGTTVHTTLEFKLVPTLIQNGTSASLGLAIGTRF
jgi:hypothetical protein